MSDIIIKPQGRVPPVIVELTEGIDVTVVDRRGLQGVPGPGVPAGGTDGQVLVKVGALNYATEWVNPSAAGAVDWTDIIGKPATFPPEAHTQAFSTITATPTTLVGYGITDAATAAQGALAATALQPGAQIPWTDVTGKPATFAPSAHGHIIGDVTGLQVALDGKQPLSAVLTATTSSFTTADETKLDGIATGATANATDASLRDRTTHTGTQLSSTISDFAAAVSGNAAVTANTAKVTNATHTGDATGATALTLATVNANVGAFGSASQVATFTVNAKGLTTAAGATPIAIPASQVTDFAAASRAQTEAELVAGTNITITPAGSGATRTLTIAAAGGGAGTNLTYTAATRVIASDTGTDATLPLVTSGDAGLAPASGGGTANFLRADGTWAAPAGGGGGSYQSPLWSHLA